MYGLKTLLMCLLLSSSTVCLAQQGSGAYNQFKQFRLSNMDSAFYFAEKAFSYALEDGDSMLMVKARNAAAWILSEKDVHLKAAAYYLEAYRLAVQQNYTEQLIYLTNNLGLNYYRRGVYDESLKYHLLSLELREKKGDPQDLAVTKNNLGLVYYKLKQYDHAIKYFRESLSTDLELGKTLQVFKSYINIGLCEIGQGNYEEALKLFDQVISGCSECPPDITVEAYNGLGLAFYTMGVESMAVKNFEISESYARRLNFSSGSIVNNHYLSKIAFSNKDFEAARKYLNLSIQAAENANSMLWLKNNYLILSTLEEMAGDFEQALVYHKKYTALQDSLINEQVIQNIQSLQTDYHDKKYKQYLASMDLRLAEQNKINILLGSMVLLISIVGLVLYNSNKNRKRATRLISKAYIEVERQKDRLETAVVQRTAALKKSNQDLGNFIYKTSHDIRGPLSTLKGICKIAMMEVSDSVAVKYFKKLENTSDNLIDILSRIQNIDHIKNYKLLKSCVNLHQLIVEIIDSIDENIKKDVLCKVSIPENQVIVSDANLLKIVAKNIIHNAFKFSRKHYNDPSFISVTFTQNKEHYSVHVTDNGYGIEESELGKIFDLFYKYDMRIGERNSAGIGLHLADMAIKKLHGNITVESTPLVKTTFTINLPIAKTVAEEK